MHNVIKANYVMIKDDEVKVIDSNPKDNFTPMSFRQAVELEPDENDDEDENNSNDSFQVNHLDNSSSKLQEMQSYAQILLEDAKRDAESIRIDAMMRAKQDAENKMKEASANGYKQGMDKAEAEIQAKLNHLKDQELELEQEYDRKVKELQQNMSVLLISLVQKITGVVIEDQSIISYLVMDAMKGQSSCNEFRIIVSKADFPEIESKMDQLKEMVRSTAIITLVENPEFEKNQCKIETDKNIIDCSIATKVSNLIMALKLI